MLVLIPLENNGKRPIAKGWASPSYSPPAVWPDGANVGLRTDGIVVVDCDTEEAASAWRDKGGPNTPFLVKTPRGWHFYYRLPEGVTFRPGPLTEKTDIKTGPGAFVLIPPSQINGTTYKWGGWGWDGDRSKLPEAPVALIRELLGASNTASEATGEGWDKIPDGRRNTTLTALAGSLRKQGAGAEVIASTLATVNANRCDPPLEDAEIVTIVRSVLRYEPDPDEAPGDIEILIDGGDPTEPQEERPLVLWADRLEVPPPPRWLRFPYLPAGRLVLVDGNEGIGKGMFATWIAVQAAAGGFDGGPMPVLWGSTEDDPAEDILRRLLAAGYDATEHEPIGFLNGEAIGWRYPQDIGKLAAIVRETGAKVLILDPGRSFLGPPEGVGGVEFSYNNEALVRPGLEALNLLARKLDVMVVFIHHWNKNLTASIRVRSSGSAAFAQTVRHRVTLNYLNGEHALAVEKSNLTSREHTVTQYCLNEVEEYATAKFVWGDPEMAVDLDEWEQQHRGETKLNETEEASLNASLVADAATRELAAGAPFWSRDELKQRFGFSQRLARGVVEELRRDGLIIHGQRNRLLWAGE